MPKSLPLRLCVFAGEILLAIIILASFAFATRNSAFDVEAGGLQATAIGRLALTGNGYGQ